VQNVAIGVRYRAMEQDIARVSVREHRGERFGEED
jgi:hypothetical protein